jgi:hypothetical protein
MLVFFAFSNSGLRVKMSIANPPRRPAAAVAAAAAAAAATAAAAAAEAAAVENVRIVGESTGQRESS